MPGRLYTQYPGEGTQTGGFVQVPSANVKVMPGPGRGEPEPEEKTNMNPESVPVTLVNDGVEPQLPTKENAEVVKLVP